MKLIPASSARWMMRTESSWSVLPHAPNIIAPRQSGVTFTPVVPRVRCSMARTLLRRFASHVAGALHETARPPLAPPEPTCEHWALDMSTSGYPEAPPASDVAFDVERFEWTAVDRLEVRGRWTGVRGRRFMRPSLNIGVSRGRRRLIALLDHKPWAAGDGDAWVAAFRWEGERGDVGPAVLEVGAGLQVQLPAPREPRHVREA